MAQRTLESALAQYKMVCDRLDAVNAEHAAKVVELNNVKTKIRSWLMENIKDAEVPSWVFDVDPVLNWNICKRMMLLCPAT